MQGVLFFKYMITKVEFGLLMHVELMKEDSESHVSHNLKAKTSCDRQTNVTRLNFSTPLVGRCKPLTLLLLWVTKTEFQARILSRQVMRIKKISTRGLMVDSITNSLNWHYKNGMADDRDNCCGDPGSYRVKESCYWNHETNADVTINSIDSIKKTFGLSLWKMLLFQTKWAKTRVIQIVGQV